MTNYIDTILPTNGMKIMQYAKFNRLVIIRNTKMPSSVEILFARFSKLLMCMTCIV